MLVNYNGMTVETVNGLEIIFSVKKSGLFFLQANMKSEIVQKIEEFQESIAIIIKYGDPILNEWSSDANINEPILREAN